MNSQSDCNNCKDQKYEVYINTSEKPDNLYDVMRMIGIGTSPMHTKLLIDHYKKEEYTILYIGNEQEASPILRDLLYHGISYAKIRKL